jgi:hypothetical protein
MPVCLDMRRLCIAVISVANADFGREFARVIWAAGEIRR